MEEDSRAKWLRYRNEAAVAIAAGTLIIDCRNPLERDKRAGQAKFLADWNSGKVEAVTVAEIFKDAIYIFKL
jgi:hypothetical protein